MASGNDSAFSTAVPGTGFIIGLLVASLAFLAAVLWLGSAPAVAAKQKTVNYLSGAAGTIDADASGWLSRTEDETCDPGSGFICRPMVVSVSADGTPPNHHLKVDTRASYMPPMPSTWPDARLMSPMFYYRGVDGRLPESLAFSMKVREAIGPFSPGIPGSPLPGVHYQVGAIDLTEDESTATPGGVTLVPSTVITDANVWRQAPAVVLDPSALKIGHHYRIVVWLQVVGEGPAGSVEFDDFRVDATGTVADEGEILPPPAVIPEGTGYFYRNRLYIRIRCPRGYRPKCRIKAQALTRRKRGKAMSKAVATTVKRGTWKRGALLIRKKYRKRIERFASTPNRRTVTVRLRVRSKRGKKKGQVFYRLRVKTRRAPAS